MNGLNRMTRVVGTTEVVSMTEITGMTRMAMTII